MHLETARKTNPLLGNAVRIKIDFLPESLRTQCRSLIESYHGIHGYACLPNMLWRTGLGHLIEKNKDFSQLLRKASTTRSAKKSNEGFVAIATAILSSEILASDFSGWSKMFPDARPAANGILNCRAFGSFTSLMEQYLYPPKHIDPAIIVALMPRPDREANAKDTRPIFTSRLSNDAPVFGNLDGDHAPLVRDSALSRLTAMNQA